MSSWISRRIIKDYQNYQVTYTNYTFCIIWRQYWVTIVNSSYKTGFTSADWKKDCNNERENNSLMILKTVLTAAC